MNGKGTRPCIGYNWQKWEANFDSINWGKRPAKQNKEKKNEARKLQSVRNR